MTIPEGFLLSDAELRDVGDLAERIATLQSRQRLAWADGGDRWAMLPKRDQSGDWCLLAADREAVRRGRETIRAFVGPAVGHVSPSTDVVLSDDGQELRLVTVRCVADREALASSVELMVNVRLDQPKPRLVAEPSLPLLIRDFFLSCEFGDRSRSDSLLVQIETLGLLASENLRFLKIEQLSKFGLWSELRDSPWFVEVSRARRPMRTTNSLLEALWRTTFDDLAVGANPAAALEVFEEQDLGSTFASLLASTDDPTTPAGRRLLAVATRAHQDGMRLERLVAGAPPGERDVLQQLGGLAEAGPSEAAKTETAVRPSEFFAAGEFVAAIEAAIESGVSQDLEFAVRSAYELNDPARCRQVVEALEGVESAALPTTREFATIVSEVQRLAADDCSGWLNWFERLAGPERWTAASGVARELAARWGETELKNPADAARAANLLAVALDGANRVEVRRGLDALCALVSRIFDESAAEPLVDAVLLALASDENPSEATRAAYLDLLGLVLEEGPAGPRYRDLVSTAASLWTEAQSPEVAAWGVDITDALAVAPCPDHDVRRSFVNLVGQSAVGFAQRVPSDLKRLLSAIAIECGTVVSWPTGPSTAEETDPWSRLDGKTVGLYSLVGNIGLRLEGRLKSLCEGVTVVSNADKVATDALRSMASSVDYLVVDTRHASHAATAGIDAVRPRSDQLFPQGGGVTSFIACIREALDSA